MSRVDCHCQQQTHGIHDYVTLAARHLLASIVAVRPPFSVVLTDWLSMMAALGTVFLPAA